MLLPQQCRAARALLGWTQKDLSDASTLSKTSINNFERGLSAMKSESLAMVQDTFFKKGIVLTQQGGVEYQHDRIVLIKTINDLSESLFHKISSSPASPVYFYIPDHSILMKQPNILLLPIIQSFDEHKFYIVNAGRSLTPQETDAYDNLHIRRLLPTPSDHFPTVIASASFCFYQTWQDECFLSIDQRRFATAETLRLKMLWNQCHTIEC